MSDSIREISVSELDIGGLLGTGTFAKVFETAPTIPNVPDKLAMKRLKTDDRASESAQNGLKREARLLQQVRHKHIVDLHGVSKHFQENCSADVGSGFLVLQQLEKTLDQQILEWKRHPPQLVSKTRLFGKENIDVSQARRVIDVGVGIAAALEFLHKSNIIY